MMTWLSDVIGGRRKLVLRAQQERDQLEQLLTRFREERLAIDTMLTSATKRTDDLKHLSISFDAVARKGAEVSAALSDVVTRVDALDRRMGIVERSDQHVEAVKGALAVLRKGIQELQTRQADVERLSERLDVDRRALEDFEQRVKSLVARTEP